MLYVWYQQIKQYYKLSSPQRSVTILIGQLQFYNIILDDTMTNQTNAAITSPESPRSTRDAFIDGIQVDESLDDDLPFDELPFDEPPSLVKQISPSRKYKLDGHSFYQSSSTTQTENGYIVEHHSNTLSKKLDPRTSSICGSYRSDDDDDGNSSAVSSFVSDYQITDKESVQNNFDSICGLPMSSYRSKPLRPKHPIVWKGYTCFRDTCLDASAVAAVSYDGYWERAEADRKPCRDASSVGTTLTGAVTMEDAAHADDFFLSKSLQECLEFLQISAYHFLKERIFVEDPDFYISNDDYTIDDEFDSITYCSTSTYSLRKNIDENDRWRCNIAI